MARRFIRRWLPSAESVQRHRMLAWLGPALLHPQLWALNHRTIPLGLAIGVFFGFLIPVAQIPIAVAIAIVLRANIAAAVLSTLVSNPLTFAPIYLAAFQVGGTLLGTPLAPAEIEAGMGGGTGILAWLGSVGKPLAVGLSVFATGGAIAAYFGARTLWHLAVARQWHRRKQRPVAL